MLNKKQSSLEASISAYYFAVHPLTLYFLHDYNSNFKLYFEKGLQIISKCQLPTPNPRKEQLLSFLAPNSVPNFRIQAEKNLEYEWSLYGCQQEGEEHQEFIEGAKVSLRPAWLRWTEDRVNVWEGQQDFKAIKCKLTFLTVIAKTPTELQQAFQQHLLLLNHPIETPLPPPNSIKIIDQQPQELKKEEESAKEISNLGAETIRQDNQGMSFAIFPPGDLKESKILNEYPSPQKGGEGQPLKTGNPLQKIHRLSLSDMQIADSVAKDVQNYETSKLTEKVETIAEVAEVQEVQQKPQPSHEPPTDSLHKPQNHQITMTHSQLLNEHHEIIIPPKSMLFKKKHIILAIVFLIVLAAAAYFGLSKKTKVKIPKDEKRVKGKTERTKQQNKKQEKSKQTKKDKKVIEQKVKGKKAKGRGERSKAEK